MSDTINLTAEVFRELADVAEGKKNLSDVINAITSNSEEIQKLKEHYHQFHDFVENIKKNVRESIKDEIRTNDLNAKYETSSAVEVKDDEGNTIGYMGLKAKQKKSFVEEIKEDLATDFQNSADLLTGKKTFKQVMHENITRIKEDMMENSVVFRKSASVVDGMHKGIKKSIQELRGIEKPDTGAKTRLEEVNKRVAEKINATTQNKYASLDEEQFAVAMGAAYDNLARLERFGTQDSLKKEVLDEIGLVLEEVKKRFPNAISEPTRGSYYKDADVADMEQQFIPYMREAAKGDIVLRGDVNRYNSWRNGQDATIMNGALKVTEMPFANEARWGSQDKTFIPGINHFHDPYSEGAKTLNKSELALAKAKLSKLNIR